VELRGLCSRRERLRVEVNVIRSLSVKRRVWSPAVVKRKVPLDPGLGRSHGVVGMQIDLFVLDRLPQPFDEDVVAPRIAPVHADADFVPLQYIDEARVNCDPWSVLKISGGPYRLIASSSASTQKSAVMLLEIRQLSTRRLNQSMTATRYTICGPAGYRSRCRFSFIRERNVCGGASSLRRHSGIQKIAGIEGLIFGNRRVKFRLASRRGLAADNGPLPSSSAFAAFCSIGD
jgi:hypothetical protein